MQHAITLGRAPTSLDLLSNAILAADPAASIDLRGDDLRVSTILGSKPLLLAVRNADPSLEPAQPRLLPSECCGGSGG